MRIIAALALGVAAPQSIFAQTAQVQHAPSVNGRIEGSVQQMAGEGVTFNSGAVVTGDLLVPGLPTVTINGTPTYSGTQDGTGSTLPSGYAISLNSGASLRHVIRRTNAVALPSVATVPTPGGTTSVTISTAGQTVTWANLKNLTLNSNVGQYTVPAGTYGNFSASSGTGFKLGVAGATQASVYNFQNLTLNGNSTLQVLGPVVINLANGFSANAPIGASSNPAWLTLNIKSGGFTLNSGCNLYGYVVAPSGTVIINAGTQLIGGVAAAYLTVNGNGLLKLQSAQAVNQSPGASITAPANGGNFQAPASFTLSATATDSDGSIARVEFFQGSTKIGQSTVTPYTFSVNSLTEGSYSFFVRATDNLGATGDSNPITVSVTCPNKLPAVALTAPSTGATLTAPATVTLNAAASDSDGNIAKVEFFQGAMLLGADTSSPYSFTTNALSAGSYTFSAKAYDNSGGATTSSTVTVTVVNSNQAPTISINSPANNSTFDDPASLVVSATATDADGSVSKVEFFRNGILQQTQTQAPYQLNVAGLAVGTYNFIARATDNSNATTNSTVVRVNVVHINDAPSATAQAKTTAEDTPIVLTLTGSDPDGDVLSYTIVTPPGHGILTPGAQSNIFTYTPSADFNGIDSFTFKVSDGSLQSSPATVQLTVTPVNDPPVSYPASVVLDENTATSFALRGTDVDSSSLTYMVNSGPGHGAYSGTLPNLTYAPAANYSGSDSLTYTVSDGQLTSSPATIHFTVNHVNRVPEVGLTEPLNGASYIAPVSFKLKALATDSDGAVGKVEFFQNGTKIGETTTTPCEFAVSLLAEGNYSFVARATDNSGATTDSIPVAVTVVANTPPVVALTAPVDGMSAVAPAVVTLTANASDGDGSVVRVEFYQGSTLLGQSATPPYRLTTSALTTGSYTFSAKAYDNLGAVVTSGVTNIVVTNPNQPPTVVLTAPANGTILAKSAPVQLKAAAADSDGSVGKVEFFDGAVKIGESLVSPYEFAWSGGSNGIHALTARAVDNFGATSISDTTQVVVNAPPVANAQMISVNAGSRTNITLTATDDEHDLLSFQVITQPAHGTLTGSGPNFTYVPAAGYSGGDSFTFQASDNWDASSPVTVTFDIAAGPQGPSITSQPETLLVLMSTRANQKAVRFTPIELNPTMVGSAQSTVFSELPSVNPARFGFSGSDVRSVNFDTLPDGTPLTEGAILTDQYAGIGVTMNSIPVRSNVYGGPASPPFTTFTSGTGARQEFKFNVPVVAAGLVNTSPDHDLIEFYSPGGTRLFSTGDSAPDPNVDYFVGARVNDGNLIGSMVLVNTSGDDEMDELVFEVATDRIHSGYYNYQVRAKDPAGLSLTYSLVDGPAGMLIDPVSGLLTWLADGVDAGDHPVTVRATNTLGLSDQQSFNLKVLVNHVPGISAGPDLAIGSIAESLKLQGLASDDGIPSSSQLALQWSVISGPGVVAFDHATVATPTVTFSAPGIYVLKLVGTDSLEETSDSMEVRVGLVYSGALPRDQAAWWPANGEVHEVVHGNHDIEFFPHGPSFVAGEVSQAFSFNGIDQYGRVAAHSDLDVGAAVAGFTIEFWARPPATGMSDATIMEWGAQNGAGGVQLEARNGSGHNLLVRLRDTVGGEHSFYVIGMFTEDTWVHVAFTYDKTTGVMRAYKNGSLAYEGREAVFTPRTNLPLSFGADANGADRYTGLLDEISLYNRPLTLGEIHAIYQSGVMGKAPLDDNTPPVVNAGPDVRVLMPDGVAVLEGSVIDDGKPVGGKLSVKWSQISGPGIANFVDANTDRTSATFTLPGTYLLRLDANDGVNSAQGDTVLVRVAVTTSAEPAADLAAWWPANGDVHEVVRGNHDIEFLPRGSSFAAGEVSQGFSFNGVDQFGRVKAHSDLDIGAATAGLTIEFWAKPPAAGMRDATIMAWGAQNGAGGVQLEASNGSGHNLLVRLRDTVGGEHAFYVIGVFNEDTWAHVALTYDKHSGVVRVYKNGALAYEGNEGVFTPLTNLPLNFGANQNGVDFYTGILDEITLYNRPLSFDEVHDIYRAGEAGKTPLGENIPPVVSAGPDVQVLTASGVAALEGSVTDDGKPLGGKLSVKWSQVSGPGTANFSDVHAAKTTATFTLPGMYLLRLDADDGINSAQGDTMLVRVAVTTSVGLPGDQVAWWPANGDVHEVVHGHHDIEFLPRGPSFVAGEVSQGFGFNGIDQYGRVPAHSDLDLGAAAAGLTIEFWAKPPANGMLDGTILQWGAQNGASGVQLEARDHSGHNLLVRLRDTVGGEHSFYVIGMFTEDTWTHVALTYDKVTGVVRVYKNGAVAYEGNEGTFTPSTNLTLNFGANSSGTDRYVGTLDEISFYSRPLGAGEVKAIFDGGENGKVPGLVNAAPVVSAVAVASTTVGAPLSLSGVAADDGLPNPPSALSYNWSKVSGPGLVHFATPSLSNSSATFDAVGSYVVRLSVTDSELTTFSDVTVVVRPAPPQITMTVPVLGHLEIAGRATLVRANVVSNGNLVTKVEFFDGATKLGESAGPTALNGSDYAYVVTQGFSSGSHTLTAKLTTADGTIVTSESRLFTVLASAPPPPVLELTSPVSGFEVTAPTSLIGTISGQYLSSYAVQVRYKTSEGDLPWKTVSSGANAVSAASLGTLDPTLLLNGLYEIRLTATDQTGLIFSEQPPYHWVSITGGMKIGANVLNHTDLTVATGGLPLSVVRHYDSTDPRSGDFGIGTSLATKAYSVQVSQNLGEAWYAYTVSGFEGAPQYVIDPAPPLEATGVEPEPRVVSITLPDNSTFRFSARLTPNRTYTEIVGGQIVFDPMPGTIGQLEAVNESTFELENEVLSDSNFGSTDLIDFDGVALDPHAYRLTTLDGTRYIISTTQGVLEVTSRNGISTTYSANRIAQSTGAAIDLVRDSSGRITAVKDQSGQSVNYSYDSTGHLLTVTDREGRVTTYGYLEGTSLMTSIKEPGAILPEYDAYDAVGRLISKVDGSLANGGTLTENDFVNRIEKHRDALNRVTTVEYDIFGNVIRRTNALGFDTKYAFTDARFRDKPTVVTDAEGGITRYHYNAQGLADTVTDANGHATHYTYNSTGQLLTETDALGRALVQTYDGQGNLLTRTDRAGNTTTFTYDAMGNVLTEHSPLGNETRYTYNALGLPLTETDYAPDNTPGRKRSYTYDVNGHLTSETSYRTDPQAAEIAIVTSYAYDLNGQPTKTTYPDGTFSTKTYNASGRLGSETDRSGNVVSYSYDDAGRPTRTTYADGSYEEKTYDAVGRVISERNVFGQSSTTGYDDADHLLSITFPGIGTQSHTYDKVGRMLTDTDEGGRVTTTAYDPVGNVTKVTYPDGTSTDLGYDEVDCLKTASARVFFAPTDSGIAYDPIPSGVDLSEPGALAKYPSATLIASSDQSVSSAFSQIKLPFGYRVEPAGFKSRKLGEPQKAFGKLRARVAQASPTPPSASEKPAYHYSYDANGRMKSIINPDGSSSSIDYDSVGRPIKTSNEKNQIWTYEYDLSSNDPARRTAVRGPLEYVESYHYTSSGDMDTAVDPLGNISEHHYNAAGQCTGITYLDSNKTILSTEKFEDFDNEGNPRKVTDRENGITIIKDDRTGNKKSGDRVLKRQVGSVEYVTTETYDEAGNLKKSVDPRGAVTLHEYDFLNRRILTALPDGRKIQTVYGTRNRVDKVNEVSSDGSEIHTTAYTYDNNDKVTRTVRSHNTGADNVTVDSEYLADGRAASVSSPYLADETPRKTSIIYDDVHRVVTITDPMDRVMVRTHDALGQLIKETDTAGTTTQRGYDDLNRLTSITVTGVPDPVTHAVVSVTTKMSYDALGNLLSRTEAAGTTDARTTSFTYEYKKGGTLITTTYADASTTKSFQDTRGLVTSLTTQRGNTVETAYDELGRPVSVTGPLGQESTYSYPDFGGKQVVTDALGRTVTRMFDTSQRLMEEKLPDDFGSRVYTYDSFSKLRTAKNTRGHSTTTEYDFMGRPTKVTRPDSTTITTTYTALGQPRRITDARGFVTQYDYDPVLHHLTSVTQAEGNAKARTTAYGYDAADRVNQITAPNGQVTDLVFDALGRQIKRSSMLDADGTKYDETFTYFQTGELKTHHDFRGDTAHVYDALGHPTFITNPLNQLTQTEYDSEGNLMKMIDAANRETTYVYDALGRLTKTTLPQGAVETNEYDAYHLLKSTLASVVDSGVPVVTEFKYDGLDHVKTTIRHSSPHNVSESRTYDGEGNLINTNDAAGNDTNFDYDSLNQLVLITHPDLATEAFTYDAQGNRLTHTHLPIADDRVYTYTPHGEVETVADALGHITRFAYDEAGNLQNVRDPLGRITANEYDLANRLRKVTRPGNRVSTFDYDMAGNRVAVTDASNNTRRYEYDSLGRLKRALTPLYGALASMAVNHSDPSGSVVDIAGQKFAASVLTYDPVGNLETLTDPNNHKTTFKYDAGNRLTHTYLPANPTTAHEVNGYDFAGRRVSRTDAEGATTSYEYDSLSRLTSVQPPSSHVGANVSYAYDLRGLRLSMTDGLGTTNYSYDNRGRRLTEKTPYAGSLVYAYDSLGRLTNLHSTNAGGTNTTYGYDDASRLTTVFDALRSETTWYDYNDADQLTRVTQPNGTLTTQTYDAAGRPDVTTTSRGINALFSQKYTYTPTDQVDTATTTISRPTPFLPLHNGVGYTYDSSDRLLRETHLGDTVNGQIDYTLDPAGNRTARTSTIAGVGAQSFVYDPNNAFASLFTYDARGNPTAGPLFPGSFNDTYDYLDQHASRAGDVEYLYDGDGRRVGHRAFDSVSGRWINHTRLISSINPTGYDQDVEEFTEGVLSSSYTIGHSRLAGQRFVDEAVTAQGLTIALGTDGKVYTWGNGQKSPTMVPGLSGIIAVGAGASHYLALGADGKVYSWGTSNASGQLGRGGAIGTPLAIPGLENVAAISTQLDHTLALTTDGVVYAWGDNTSGQLGDGTTTNRGSPVEVVTGAISIAAGQVHSYALLPDGKAEAWGDNTYGQLGQAGTSPVLAPTSIPGLTNVTELAAGAFHTLALKADGTVVTWGDNSFGQLGDPAVLTSRFVPTWIPGIAGVTAIAAGARHSLALQSDGSVLAWGENRSGQLGIGYPDNQYSPANVPGLRGVVHFAAGARSSYATTATGATYVMGANRNDQLGVGDTTTATTPQLLPVGTNPAFAAIASGGEAGTTRNQQAIGLHDQFFAFDAHNHTRLLTDVTGATTQTCSYDAFGNLLNATDSSGYSVPATGYSLLTVTNPYLYRGERLEVETGRYHLRARDYDASLGRLATLDSYAGDPESPISLNRYAYTEANPVGSVDPSGHFSLSVWELLDQMDAVNRQWDDFTAAMRQGSEDVVMGYVNIPGTVTIIPKKQRTIWLNASRSGGLIGSLVGDAGGVRTAEGDTVGYSGGSDLFFHTNANPRHRLSLIERTVEQAWASAYNLRRTLNVGPPENVTNPLAAQRRWPAQLYHDAILQSQLRSQMIEGPVEGRFTRSSDRQLYSYARTTLSATAVKNLSAAQAGGLLDWKSTMQSGTNGLDAGFLRSIRATGFDPKLQSDLFYEGLQEGYGKASRGLGVFAGGAALAFIPGGTSATASFSQTVLSGIRSGLIFTGVRQTVTVAIDPRAAFSIEDAALDVGSIAALEIGFRTIPTVADKLLNIPFAQLTGQTVRLGRQVASRTINIADNLAQDARALIRGGVEGINEWQGQVNMGADPAPFVKGAIKELRLDRAARAARKQAKKTALENATAISAFENEGGRSSRFETVSQDREARPSKLDPRRIHFMQSSIKNETGDFTVLENAAALRAGTLKPTDLELIRVWEDDVGKIWTLDHRRLGAFRLAELDEIPVQWASPKTVAEDMWKKSTRTGGLSIRLKLGKGQNIIIK